MGKGSKRRPCCISNEERDLRYEYAEGKITLEEFNRRLQELKDNGNFFRNMG